MELSEAKGQRVGGEPDGVYGMVNEIKVKPQVSAEDINRRIQSALARQASLDAKNIHVDIDGAR